MTVRLEDGGREPGNYSETSDSSNTLVVFEQMTWIQL